MLLYADSSDEEDDALDSRDESADEIFSLQTNNPRHRHDSLREIVFLKDVKAGSQSFKEKDRGSRLSVTKGEGRMRPIQLNSKDLLFCDKEISVNLSPSNEAALSHEGRKVDGAVQVRTPQQKAKSPGSKDVPVVHSLNTPPDITSGEGNVR